MIDTLNSDEIFVFGSNAAGRHGAGAALQARLKFGALYGVGEGLTGQCYAFPTLDDNLQQRSVDELNKSAALFYEIALLFPDKKFILTKVGCGLAGFDELFIWSLFLDAPDNILLPEDWELARRCVQAIIKQ